MKAFFEEYGLIIVVIIVIAVLISIAIIQSRKGGNQINKTFDDFSTHAEDIVNEQFSAAADSSGGTN